MVRYYDYTRRKIFFSEIAIISFYVATPTSSLCMRVCQEGGTIAKVSCRMSQGISIGHFDSENLSFQEETKYTQGRQISTVHQSDVNYANTEKARNYGTVSLTLKLIVRSWLCVYYVHVV